MDAAEFDKFAEEYLATHQQNLKISGEAPDYFARYKLEELRRLWSRQGLAEPAAGDQSHCCFLPVRCGLFGRWHHP